MAMKPTSNGARHHDRNAGRMRALEMSINVAVTGAKQGSKLFRRVFGIDSPALERALKDLHLVREEFIWRYQKLNAQRKGDAHAG